MASGHDVWNTVALGQRQGWLHSNDSHLQYLIMFKRRTITQGFTMGNKRARQFCMQPTIWWPCLWLPREGVNRKAGDLSLWLSQSCRITLYPNFQLLFHRLSFYNSIRFPKTKFYKIKLWGNVPGHSLLVLEYTFYCFVFFCFCRCEEMTGREGKLFCSQCQGCSALWWAGCHCHGEDVIIVGRME